LLPAAPADSGMRPSARTRRRSRREPGDDAVERQILAGAVTPVLVLDIACSKAARSQDQLVGQADQVHCRKFRARRLVAVVVQHVDASIAELAIEVLGGGTALVVGRPQIDQPEPEW